MSLPRHNAPAYAEIPACEREQRHWLPRTALALASLLLLGLATRLFRLDSRSLWLDETFTATYVRFHSWQQALTYSHMDPDQMPLLYGIVWLLRGLGGWEWVVRLPSAIAGALSVPALYLLGSTLFSRRVGVLSAIFLAVSPFAVWYGQEARAYALVMLFTIIQMWAVYRAVDTNRFRFWALFVVSTVLNLYTHYTALAMLGSAVAFIVGAALLRLRAERGLKPGDVAPLAISLAIIALAYLPWLPYLQRFLHDPASGFGRAQTALLPSFTGMGGLLEPLGITWLVLALLLCGAAALPFLVQRTQYRLPVLLIGCWIGLPLALLFLKLQAGIFLLTPRYFSMLFPGAMLLVVLGIERSSDLLQRFRPVPARQAFPVLTGAALLQTVVMLGISYAHPKDDYRAAAATVTRADPHAVLLAIGSGDDFVKQAMDYYLWLYRSDVLVEDARDIDGAALQQLRERGVQVWGAIFGAVQLPPIEKTPPPGFRRHTFTGIILLQPTSGDAQQQAEELLNWSAQFDPSVAATKLLVDAQGHRAQIGPNLLRPPARAGAWTLQSDEQVHGDAILMRPGGLQANAVGVAAAVSAGASYLVSFQCRGPESALHAFAIPTTGKGTWLAIYPTGAGYHCPAGQAWHSVLFAFTAPAATERIAIWLRAEGNGNAAFRHIQLRSITPLHL